MLTLSNSQMFLVSLCPHLVLALDFDLFAPSASLVFTLVSLFLRNLSCPLSQHNLWQDQFQLASAASVTPQSFPWYSGSFILLFSFGRLRKAGHLDVRPWASHLPTLASGSTSVKRGGGYLTSWSFLKLMCYKTVTSTVSIHKPYPANCFHGIILAFLEDCLWSGLKMEFETNWISWEVNQLWVICFQLEWG